MGLFYLSLLVRVQAKQSAPSEQRGTLSRRLKRRIQLCLDVPEWRRIVLSQVLALVAA